MKLCIMVVGADLNFAEEVAHDIALRAEKLVSRHDGLLPILAISTESMNNILKGSAPMVPMYNEADCRLMLGADNEGSVYLDRVYAELQKVCQSRRLPMEIQRMSEAVLAECRRCNLDRVWLQDTTVTASERLMSQRLTAAGVQVCQPDNHEAQTALWYAIAKIASANSAETKARLVNECRMKLTELSCEVKAPGVVMDYTAKPFLKSRGLAAEWGPTVIDAYDLYVSMAVDWMTEKLSRV